MSSHSFAIPVKILGHRASVNATCMPIEVFVGRQERATIDGRRRYHSTVLIITWAHLIVNGMRQLFTVRNKFVGKTQTFEFLGTHFLTLLLRLSMGSFNSLWRGGD